MSHELLTYIWPYGYHLQMTMQLLSLHYFLYTRWRSYRGLVTNLFPSHNTQEFGRRTTLLTCYGSLQNVLKRPPPFITEVVLFPPVSVSAFLYKRSSVMSLPAFVIFFACVYCKPLKSVQLKLPSLKSICSVNTFGRRYSSSLSC